MLAHLQRWQDAHEDVALATLVDVRGSAPQRAGARLGVTRGGAMAGSVSGGCVENDVVERALGVLADGAPVVARYGIADESGLDVGLACAGTIDVLIERFAPSAAWQALAGAIAARRPAALAVGVAPAALAGRKLVVLGDDATVGAIDPALDAEVAARARARRERGGTEVVTLPCRGEQAAVYLEGFPPPPRLLVVGATHTAIALARLARPLGYHVTVIDPRRAYATPERLPDADELVLRAPGEALAEARLDARAAVVTLTHDPRFDLPALAAALRSDAGYVGAMGSRATHARRAAALAREGFGATDLARIHAPIGLDIGARTPEEIALAILAEMVAARAGRDGLPLAGKQGRIHGDD
jgi:xanthine dehydrogenase accessory factor